MMKLFLLLVLIFYSIFLFSGCSAETSNGDITLNSTITTSSLLWNESQGRFFTNDLTKAQEYIPFRIVLPTYIPIIINKSPMIDGPLGTEKFNDVIDINIQYDGYSKNTENVMVLITEANSQYSLGDIQLNPNLELINIAGFEVIKRKTDTSKTSIAFNFTWKGIFYVLWMQLSTNDGSFNIDEESLKIVDSLINQLK